MVIERRALKVTFSIFLGLALLPFWADAARAETITVTSTADPGDGNCATNGCTLREALTAANSDVDTDVVGFNITGAGPHVIQPASGLPTITQPISLDGATEPDYAGEPVVVINGDNAGDVDGLTLTAGNSTIKGLVINGFDGVGGGGRAGIRIPSGGSNVVVDNFIGTDATGTSAVRNWWGIYLQSASNQIGTGATSGNVIAGNSTDVAIVGDAADGNNIYANLIGTSKTGNQILTTFTGVLVDQGDDTNIGWPSEGLGNVINALSGNGISLFQDSDDNEIYGNLIGTNASGTADAASGNGAVGLSISNNSNDNIIGGDTPAGRNLISGNRIGIELGASFSDGAWNNHVLGNYIGTDISGEDPLPNDSHGVVVYNGNNNVGNTTGGGNVIAFNPNAGVIVSSALANNTGTRIVGNSIHSNGNLGIEIDPAGPTPNDLNDPDTGPNNLQNHPQIDLVAPTRGGVNIRGIFNSTPNQNFTLEFFTSPQQDPSGFGEGARFLGRVSGLTNASGNLVLDVHLVKKITPGHFVTATATGPSGTSEFSEAMRFCTKLGTQGNDTLTGTAGRDVLCGLGGADELVGLGQRDALLGGGGNDKLLGKGGADLLFGQKGRDLLSGGGGNDDLLGGPGVDTCKQGPGSGLRASCERR